jgi:hypothetical protein
MAEKTYVACKIPGGMQICKWKSGFDDGTGDGVKTTVRDGHAIRLNGPARARGEQFGITEIDADWRFADWLAQNKMNAFVGEGMIYEIKAADDPAKQP